MSSSIGSVFTSLKKKNDEITAAKRKARESKTGKKRVGHGQWVSTNSNNNSKKNNEMSKVGNVKTTPSPAGTTVESQLKYWSDPKNRAKIKSAMDKFHGKNTKSSKKNNTKVVKKNTNNNSSSNTTTPKKGGVSAAEKKRQSEIIGRKNPKLEKLRSQLGLGGNKSSSDTTVPDLVSLGKAGKADAVKGKTRQEMRREARDDKKARRRAGRTAKQTLKTPGGSITDEQNTANIAAEKAKIQKRREGRNQFLRNFGSQLTRGVQAGPKEGFKDDKKGVDFYNTQKNETTPKSPEQQEFENYANMQFDSISSKMGLTQDYDNQNIQNAGFGLGSYKSSDYIPTFNPSQEKEEDSTPQTAMNKIYKQKRGY